MGIPLLTALAPGGLAKELLPGIVAGELTTAFAMPAMGRLPGAAGSTVTARRTGSGWALDGEVPAVTDGVDASVLLLPASTQDGTCLFAVLSDAPGLHREPRQTMDLTRRQARLRLAGTPGELAASSAESSDACAKVFAVASVLIAAEQIGGARHMLEETCKHVSQRIQFGMPIGTFQAVKHRCADMFISLEQARSLTYHAIGRLHEEPGGAQLTVHMARAVASECFYRTAASAIQLHGGLGFTWEHQAHLYFKRAVADAVLLGTADEHYEAIADQVLPD
jgi:alkylation response protein AidB-like acyl-CoA dehydrogenase